MIISVTGEKERVEALHTYDLLDTLPEEELDGLTNFAASICNVPFAMITLVDENRLWFKSKFGLDVSEAPRNAGFCLHAIEAGEDLFEINDTATNALYASNVLAKEEPHIRFYAGVPLVSPQGYRLGTLCVMDVVPRHLGADQKKTLKTLSKFVVNQFELRKNKAELELNKNRYHKMVEEAGDIIYTCDFKGEFTYINRQTVKITGFSVEELLQRHFTSLIIPEWKEKVNSFYDRQFTGRVPETVLEFPIHVKSGELKWVEQTVTLNFKDGRPDHFQGIVRDINTRKREEEELEKTMHAKEQFLANMSHEIRTPLSGVLGFAELLKDTGLNEEQAEFVNAIGTSGKNLLGVINDILDYSKIEAGMMSFEKVPLSLRSTFSSLAIFFNEKAKQKKIKIDFSTDTNIPEVVIGDPTRFTQIINNLAGNAIKFTSAGSIKVSAEAVKEKEDKIFIKIRVSDTGIGIPADKHQFIFERFNQASGDTTRKYGGTGLGLSIVKSLVELQGGTITLESSPGKGSVFTIVLPFGKIEKGDVALLDPEKFNPEEKLQREVSVLLVEDNYLNQRLALKVLSGFGFKTSLAANGNQALKKLNSGSFDLILMDMQMPGMDGYETTTVIRKKLGSGIPIIAMTAHAMADEKQRCMELGMNDYISKPFKVRELYEKIMNQLRPGKMLPGKSNEKKEAVNVKQGEELLDLSWIIKLSGGDPGFVSEVLEIFIHDTPPELQNIREGIRKMDFARIRTSLHTMRSSIRLLGLNDKLEPVLDKMENMAQNEEMPAVKKLYSTLNTTVNKAIEEARRRNNMQVPAAAC
jgi:PAS domain S-box-containing protein